LALAAPSQLEKYVDLDLKVRRGDFMKTIARRYSDRLVDHARVWARKAGRTYEYRTGQFRKDEWAQKLIRDHGIFEGLVGILCTLETCPSFALIPGPGRPRFVRRNRQQRVLGDIMTSRFRISNGPDVGDILDSIEALQA
jgi:hypothetical protein